MLKKFGHGNHAFFKHSLKATYEKNNLSLCCQRVYKVKPGIPIQLLERRDLWQSLGADHLIRGGGGLWFFLRYQTFLFDTQLKRTIFFRPYQKQTIFFLSGKTRNNFFHHLFHFILRTPCYYNKFSRCHHIYLNFSPCFLIRKTIVWNNC